MCHQIVVCSRVNIQTHYIGLPAFDMFKEEGVFENNTHIQLHTTLGLYTSIVHLSNAL